VSLPHDGYSGGTEKRKGISSGGIWQKSLRDFQRDSPIMINGSSRPIVRKKNVTFRKNNLKEVGGGGRRKEYLTVKKCLTTPQLEERKRVHRGVGFGDMITRGRLKGGCITRVRGLAKRPAAGVWWRPEGGGPYKNSGCAQGALWRTHRGSFNHCKTGC